MAQCTANSKRTHERCKREACEGRKTCKWHGGTVPVGPAHHAFKHGRRSKYMPTRMMDDFMASDEDSELLSMREEIRMLDARLNDVLQRVDSGEAGKHWKRFNDTWRQFQAAQRNGDTAMMAIALNDHGDAVKSGKTDWAAWGEVSKLVNQRKVLVESERKRELEARHVINVEQAMAIMGFLIEAVRLHATPDVVRAVTDEYGRLVGRRLPEASFSVRTAD